MSTPALRQLVSQLSEAIAGMGLDQPMGNVEAVARACRRVERLYGEVTKATGSREDADSAARAFLKGHVLDAWQLDMVASAISQPIKEQGGAMVMGSARFGELLHIYTEEAQRGELWRLTWHGLLYSYFIYAPVEGAPASEQKGWESLRACLERTWPMLDKQSGTGLVPEWVTVLRADAAILSAKPVERYADAYLRGQTDAVEALAEQLGIPSSSWFWHALVLAAVRSATSRTDAQFVELIPMLIDLLRSKPAFRDEGLELILVRYHACKKTPMNEALRDFACNPKVWRNPKLRSAGLAPGWNRVPDDVWQMVLGWVNAQSLKDFFDILAARNQADDGRRDFWLQYLNQITWTRLIFSRETLALQRRDEAVRALIAREEGSYAEIGKPGVDAFLMQIGNFLIVEFSKKPHASYVYEQDKVPFGIQDRFYEGGTGDLAAGYYNQARAARITHIPPWQDGAAASLGALGIHPDNAGKSRRTSSAPVAPPKPPAKPAYGGPNMGDLNRLVVKFRGVQVDDRRRAAGGRLWVNDPSQNAQLAAQLKALGFKWASSRQAWYFPES